MKINWIKILQQSAMICVACFLLWIAGSRAFRLNEGLKEVDIGTHGNIALILTLVLGVVFGMGLAAAFFFLARKQSADE